MSQMIVGGADWRISVSINSCNDMMLEIVDNNGCGVQVPLTVDIRRVLNCVEIIQRFPERHIGLRSWLNKIEKPENP